MAFEFWVGLVVGIVLAGLACAFLLLVIGATAGPRRERSAVAIHPHPGVYTAEALAQEVERVLGMPCKYDPESGWFTVRRPK